MKYLSNIKDVYAELEVLQMAEICLKHEGKSTHINTIKIVNTCDELEDLARKYYKNEGEDKVLIKVENYPFKNIEESDISIYEAVILKEGSLFEIEMFSTSKPESLEDCIKWNEKELILNLI